MTPLFRTALSLTFSSVILLGVEASGQVPYNQERQSALNDGFDRMRGISGTVRTSGGSPVAGVSIIIRNLQTGMTVFSGTTGSNGSFDAFGLPFGSFEVIARTGIEEDRQVARADEPAYVSLTLNPPKKAVVAEPVTLLDLKAPKKAQEALAKGREAIAAQDYSKAQKQFEKALEIYPDYVSALTLLAHVQSQTDLSKAISTAQRAVELAPESGFAHATLAAAFNAGGQSGLGLDEANKAIALSPQDWQAHHERALALAASGHLQDALASASRADELTRGQSYMARLLHCRVLAALGREDEARARLDAFIRTAPDKHMRDLAEAEMVNSFVKK